MRLNQSVLPLKSSRLLLLAGVLLLAASSAAGCGQPDHKQQMQSYGHDGYMGLSNSNPNIPNKHSYLNYGSDGKFVGELIKKMDGVQKSWIHFNGEHLVVHLTVKPGMSDAQMKQLQHKAEETLQYNMPRYEVRVKTSR
ncbi:hypothetical protein [Paenibacillus sp. Leaf72]|uniref:hypothetical protein n=1 Tax=Paenibacillus sp. Leaf72 TaxID=1736234 RepID=UPI0006F750E5|nr:hypothetical protein [Paenibacillus sp. Leaf72]KQO06268.1 hypothetical protein ASF12_32745 [Paenibacillus sp. Leaf72]